MRYLLIIPFLLCTNLCNAQKAGNIWYFGTNAGINFNTTPPSALTNGALTTNEGCASIADPTTGNLLFYTDGIKVWDKNHNQMPGSIATPLLGDPSSTQSGVIVPKPGNPSIYYIFTTPAQAGLNGIGVITAMCYTTVDLTLNSGNGDIVNPNVAIIDSSTEKIAVIGNCAGSEYWVVGHRWNCDSFYAFKINATGVGSPIKTKVGLVHADAGSMFGNETIGYMKFSPDGSKLGLTTYTNLNTIEILDFDFATGLLSNPITEAYGFDALNGGDGPYGCSFSPDNSRFYVGYFSSTLSKIFQYNMNAGSPAAILASKTMVAASTSFIGALQNGPDGKMYIANFSSNSLDVINFPNLLGTACNYATGGISLGSGTCTFGLPGIVENFLSPSLPLFIAPTKKIICLGDTTIGIETKGLNYIITPIGSYAISADSLKAYFYPTQTTTYTVINIGACSTNDTSTFTITIDPDPVAAFGFNPSSPTLANASIALINNSLNAKTYSWIYNNAQVATSKDYTHAVNGLNKICYTLAVANATGCKDTITNCVNVEDTIVSTIFVPNAFTPNGDGFNDGFFITATNIKLKTFVIFNRLGEMVFETNILTEGWDGKYKGKLCDISTYYYLVQYTDVKNKQRSLQGDLILIR
jgi:gliding motility-associated-like protein